MTFALSKLEKFNELVEDQFKYGGQKYAQTKTKEATDILFERHGYRWLIGTIDKYTFRYGNLARERDILKIATYMYILWLKRGFHLASNGSKKPINTTVPVKLENFKLFSEKFVASKNELVKKTKKDVMNQISSIMEKWSKKTFFSISDYDIFLIYFCCFKEWSEKFSKTAGADTDCWNEIKEKLKKNDSQKSS